MLILYHISPNSMGCPPQRLGIWELKIFVTILLQNQLLEERPQLPRTNTFF